MISQYVLDRPVQQEVLRKSLHMSIALSPGVANTLGALPTIILLALGVTAYTLAEALRISGRRVGLISLITEWASRERDRDRFVLGPVTLGLGAMLALLLYPAPAATIAIYALAFGDGFASLMGRSLGGPRIPGTGGKTITGAFACFLAVYAAAFPLTRHPGEAAAIALSATLLELVPVDDLDNILLPVGTGLIASIFFSS
ncbi:diacylglycerol/polyprenol kinase family protein [Spirochaeta thermophila]|uniref:Putative phosphatidate cytidylyltransferase n=1 Tax=Winmispira thermophila (strain ATCC 49972 / DSM 6192 / RI 19.B1) TaxID=665571 RepID=E0RTD8_WINT6|nr:phosphatidate cytidylyltransferase [Spirochaeta thermophila]ADN01004.1 putative phosphatidate cytidylyltransferase [Spirochaeta thermophila DSM 6192]